MYTNKPIHHTDLKSFRQNTSTLCCGSALLHALGFRASPNPLYMSQAWAYCSSFSSSALPLSCVVWVLRQKDCCELTHSLIYVCILYSRLRALGWTHTYISWVETARVLNAWMGFFGSHRRLSLSFLCSWSEIISWTYLCITGSVVLWEQITTPLYRSG